MAQVIQFPKHRQSRWLNADTRQRCLMALDFVSNNIRFGKVDPTKMLLVYGTRDGTETNWFYVNLGFDPEDGLTKAMCRVLDDVEERTDHD